MKSYELMVALLAKLGDEETQATIDRIVDNINARGEVTDLDKRGIRRLAYEINDEREAYYVVIQFQADTDYPEVLERQLEINDNVLRYLVVRND